MSARELGVAMGYRGRELVKKIEGDAAPITPRFETRFETLKHRTQNREYRERKIESKYALPGRVKILAKPRRCSVCRDWFIFPDSKQKTCPDLNCQREHARKLAQQRRRIQRAKGRS